MAFGGVGRGFAVCGSRDDSPIQTPRIDRVVSSREPRVMRAVWLACVAVVGLAPGRARADEPAPSEPEPPTKEEPKPDAAPIEKPSLDTPILRPIRTREIVVDIPGERSTNNKLALGAI